MDLGLSFKMKTKKKGLKMMTNKLQNLVLSKRKETKKKVVDTLMMKMVVLMKKMMIVKKNLAMDQRNLAKKDSVGMNLRKRQKNKKWLEMLRDQFRLVDKEEDDIYIF